MIMFSTDVTILYLGVLMLRYIYFYVQLTSYATCIATHCYFYKALYAN